MADAEPDELLVMARSRRTLRRLLATALQRRHVPCVAVDDATLIEAPEAQDLVAVLDALVSPQHRLSLARALRSPLFDASDADLLALAAGAAGRLVGALMNWPRAMRWHRARRLLAGSAGRPRATCRRTICSTVAVGRTARAPAARARTQRAAALATVDAGAGAVAGARRRRYATPLCLGARVAPAHDHRAGAPPGRRVRAAHGARRQGLEADVVFVMDADPEPNRTETATLLVDWPVRRACAAPLRLRVQREPRPAELADAMARSSATARARGA